MKWNKPLNTIDFLFFLFQYFIVVDKIKFDAKNKGNCNPILKPYAVMGY